MLQGIKLAVAHMSDPFTLGAIAALPASKFVEKAAEKAGEVVEPEVLKRAGAQVDRLCGAIKDFFGKTGDPKAAGAITKIEAGDAAALTKLEVYLDDALEEESQEALGLREVLWAIAAEIQAMEPAIQRQPPWLIYLTLTASATLIIILLQR